MIEYLKEKYGVGEPIFIKDVQIDGYTQNAIRQRFHNMVARGELKRALRGVYFIPNGKLVSIDDILKKKYIKRGDNVIGYYGNITLANMVGLTSQVPMRKHIVSNLSTNAIRRMKWGMFKYILIRPKVAVSKDNYRILQVLDLIEDLDLYPGGYASNRVVEFAKKAGVSAEDVMNYIKYYNNKTYRNLIERGVYERLSAQ